MGELDEFAEALLDQLAVETGEEAEIERLAAQIASDASFGIEFEPVGEAAERLLPDMLDAARKLTGLEPPDALSLELTGLGAFKELKAKKVHAPAPSREYVEDMFAAIASGDAPAIAAHIGRDLVRFLVYSTYAKSYLSRISTTYGDYFEGAIHVNEFVLSRYPQIVLYRQGPPFAERQERVKAGYVGALKMTLLEEAVHSMQGPLAEANRRAVTEVNEINEELAGEIAALGDSEAASLAEYLKLPPVPAEFGAALRANLFFTLNPDNFVAGVLGPDVMTYTHVEVDPEIARVVPSLPGAYRRWLAPIQAHHAAFTIMEGMAEYAVRTILGSDGDFASYLGMFAGTDASAYAVRKSLGRDFVEAAHAQLGRGAFAELLGRTPGTRDLKNPSAWLARR